MSVASRFDHDTRPQHAPMGQPAEQISEAERLARLQLLRSQNVGPRTYFHLLRRFTTATRALAALPTLAARGGKDGYAPCPIERVDAECAAAATAGAVMLQYGDADYPHLLTLVDPAPPIIWVIGDTELFEKSSVALVGARSASALGLRTARRLARELGANGHIIVSGLARGVDAAAHEAALETGTIAVMAGGLDKPYPPENHALFDRIRESGALVSEVPFGIEPKANHFPKRNRLISGLARGVVLIEAAARSGSLITARFALEQGRDAMACPGAPEDPRAAGCNHIIRDGGALIRHAGDVEDALAGPRTLSFAEDGGEIEFDVDLFGEETMREDYVAHTDFDDEGSADGQALAEQIIELLAPHPIEIDEIARLSGATPSELSLAIFELDFAGRIEIRPGSLIALMPPED